MYVPSVLAEVVTVIDDDVDVLFPLHPVKTYFEAEVISWEAGTLTVLLRPSVHDTVHGELCSEPSPVIFIALSVVWNVNVLGMGVE